MRVTRAALVAIGLIAATVSSAKQSGPSQRDIEQHACYDDAMALCKAFVPDEAKITACMTANKAKLSPPCAALFKP